MKLKSLKMPIKARIKKLISLSVFLINAVFIHAQIQIEVTTKEARCSADGRIIVKASGGTAPYTFQLLGTTRPAQANDTFNFLPPATYTLRVTDNSGASREVSVVVTGNYQEPSIRCVVTKSTVQLVQSGGRAPYRYVYSAYATGSFTSTQTSNTFDCVPNGNHTFRIYDSCDNFFSMPCTVDVPPLLNNTKCEQINGKTTLTTTAFSGGEPPYLFTCITNNNDTFRDARGNFTQLVGCSFTLIFSDKCNRRIQTFDCGSVNATIKCANFTDRTATIIASGGQPPYRIRSLDMTQISPNGQFTNLPRNAEKYNFEVQDSCGHSKVLSVSKMELYEIVGNSCPYTGTIFLKINQVITEPDTCGKGCSSFYPYRFDCLDCAPPRTFTDEGVVGESSAIHTVDLSPLPIGTYHFNVFNGCGDSIHLTVVTKKTEPNLSTSFNCKTNQIKATTNLNGTVYILRDSLKRIIATNSTGIFNSPYSGGFYMDAIYSDCDTAHRFMTTLVEKTGICLGLSSKQISGQCVFKWLLNAAQRDATFYQLFGGPSGINVMQTNGNFKDLEPNSTYVLKTDCATDTIRTPPANLPNLSAIPYANCTGRAIIQAKGARSVLGCLQTYRDKYFIYDKNNVLISSNFTGLFDSLIAGELYQIKLQNPETCFVQTLSMRAINYQRPSLFATFGAVCGTQNTANIRAILRGGTPFTFQITNPAGIRLPINTADSTAIFTNLPVGNYVLRAFDACGNSSDYATSVGNLDIKPTSKRLCDGTLVLEIPAVDEAIYKWTNGAGATVGTTRILQIRDSVGQTFSVNISTPQPCSFNGSITVPPYNSGGNLGINHNLTATYCGDSLALNPKGDTASRYQWQWQNVACPTCQNPKIFPLNTPIYYVTITDTISKCVIKDSVNVLIEGSFMERIPNAFTPNDDGLNDIFNVIPDNCVKIVRRLRIYNRWGNVVFDKPDLSPQKKQGWDGLLNSNPMAMDVYVYILELEFVDGTTKKISGEVNLIH
jgi:gliding motility-associated-like protein